jgi:alpha-1,6-mannosyltransferase
MPKQKLVVYVVTVISLFGYIYLGYAINRYETVLLFLTYGFLFLVYLWIIKEVSVKQIQFWIIAAFVFRISLVIAVPNLSDDVYRFIWDGRLLASGFHPFAELPTYYLQPGLGIPGIDKALFDKLNSPEYFTIYPPFAQFIFWLSVKLSPHSILGSIVVMRILVIVAEMGSIFVMRLLLKKFNLPDKNVLLYALNPLVILELTGNMHFEAFVIFFLLLSISFIVDKRNIQAALSFSVAVGAKLLPLIVIPLLVFRLGWRKAFQFCVIAMLSCMLMLLPLWDTDIITGFGQSLGLYFKKFEFNASLYYLVREYGFWNKGYNIIQSTGWKLGLVSGILIVAFALSSTFAPNNQSVKSNELSTIDYRLSTLFPALLSTLCIYFLFTTTLHPWYITTLLALSVFTSLRFPMVWTALIFLTYAGYSQEGFSENLWITLMEYLFVFGYLVYELLWKKEQQPAWH